MYTLITGASSGIGKSLAKKFASKGHNLIIVARREDKLENLKWELENSFKVKVIVKIYDLTKIENVDKLYDDLKQFKINLLINNAGFGDFNNIWDVDLNKMNKMVNLNITALTALTLKFIKDYKDTNSQIINVSSIAGYRILSSAITYCATKFYVSAFTEAIDQHLKQFNSKMRVKVLAPAGTITEFGERALVKSKYSEKDIKELSKNFADSITSDKLAEFGYQLYLSDKTVGIVNEKNQFNLIDPVYPFH